MMKGADVAGILNTAILELGSSGAEQALDSFAAMKESADKSGLGMDRVSKTISSSAQTLKMWGGTLNAVTPLFNMFSDSLAKGGIGRAGLTPELLQAFTSGIEGMGFAKRAFLGIQGGMGGAGGAIGAGLEMEAAMEQGPEGMKKIVGTLTDTLKQAGGGQIITRQQAMADPALQAGFLMQRQLTMQMMGMSEANATKTLDALSGVADTGLKTGQTQTDALLKLMDAGQQIGDKGLSQAERAAQKLEQSYLAAGPDIATSTERTAERLMGISTSLKNINTLMDRGVAQGGLTMEAVQKAVSNIIESTMSAIGSLGDGPKKTKSIERIRTTSAKEADMVFADKLMGKGKPFEMPPLPIIEPSNVGQDIRQASAAKQRQQENVQAKNMQAQVNVDFTVKTRVNGEDGKTIIEVKPDKVWIEGLANNAIRAAVGTGAATTR
jgi:hypothetical protein